MTFTIHVGPNIRKSPYFDVTVADGVTAFSVYNHMFIPGSFGDPQAEYDRLIEGVAMWDVAAQRQVEIAGPHAAALVRYLTPRDLSSMQPGQGRYVPICDHDGRLINDPVLLPLAADRFWLSAADSDLGLWAQAIARERGFDARVFEPDASPMAIQGPKAEAVTRALFGDWAGALPYFGFRETTLDGIPLVLSRSGWSKQGGFELYLLEAARGGELWQKVKAAGEPFGIGPGAPNDVERLESGLFSYGADGRVQTHPVDPFEIGLGKLVALDRSDDFVGKAALQRRVADGPRRRWVGLFIDGDPLPGNGHPLDLTLGGEIVGYLSEMAFSPRLGRMIGHGMLAAAVPMDASDLRVRLPDGARPAHPTALPFLPPGWAGSEPHLLKRQTGKPA